MKIAGATALVTGADRGLGAADAQADKTGLEIQEHGTTLIVRINGGKHALFSEDIAAQLGKLVNKVDKDPDVHAVVFTGTHSDRFLSHSDVTWLQKGGVGFPPINTRIAGVVSRMARLMNRLPIIRTLAGMTRLKTLLQLDSFHATFLKMNASGTIFVAALNGSALAVGAEFAWACDLRVMAAGDFFIGQPEVLLGIMPGGGGTQRLTRLIGTHRSLVAILEGKPFTPAEALANGAVDYVVSQDEVVRKLVRPELSGIAGSHLAEYLLNEQPQVQVFGTRRWRSRMDNVQHLEGGIVKVNDKPASELTITKLGEMLERPATFKMTIRRGDQTLQVTLTTRSMV
jgi:enoyl-CoA hydratase/carnithine racemase